MINEAVQKLNEVTSVSNTVDEDSIADSGVRVQLWVRQVATLVLDGGPSWCVDGASLWLVWRPDARCWLGVGVCTSDAMRYTPAEVVMASTPTTPYQSIRGGTLSGMWNHGG